MATLAARDGSLATSGERGMASSQARPADATGILLNSTPALFFGRPLSRGDAARRSHSAIALPVSFDTGLGWRDATTSVVSRDFSFAPASLAWMLEGNLFRKSRNRLLSVESLIVGQIVSSAGRASILTSTCRMAIDARLEEIGQ